MNSLLINYYYNTISAQLGEKGIRAFTIYIENISIPKISQEAQTPFIEKTDQMLAFSKELQDIKHAFVKDLELEKVSKKLQNFEDLSFEDFIKELAKQKKIKFADKLEERNFKNDWESLFQQDSQKALALKNTIHKTDKEIDQMVYDLYDLTEEEIAIVDSN